MRVRLSGVNTIKKRLRSGVVIYYYHRATGVRIHGEPGSPEFIAGFAEGEKLMRDRLAGTFNGLIREYTLSEEFKTLAEATQREYRRMLTKAEVEFGDLPVAALNDPRIRKEFLDWRDQVAKTSGAREADHRLSAISAMLTWAKERTTIAANHLVGFRRLYKSDRVDAIWLPDQIERFMKTASVELQQALIIALHTGQRQGDILSLTWSQYDGAVLRLRQHKTRGRVDHRVVVVPCTKALRRLLDRMPRKADAILTTSTGRPFRKRWFARKWEQAAKVAGIEGLHFNDLRGTSVTMLAEAGCSVPEIATITGHSLKTVHLILEKYLSRTKHLAEAAIAKFETAKLTKFANRLQTSSTRKRKDGAK